MLDHRLTLVRNGIAARSLQGILPADRYLDTTMHQTAVPCAALRREASASAEQLDQLLFGELFEVLDEADGWLFGRAVRDGYVGYAEASALRSAPQPPTHTVRALRSYAFSEPSIKSAPTGLYSMNALLLVESREGRFLKTSGGWFVEEHLTEIGEVEIDPVAVAQRFVGTPYLWGGRESLGLDCSGLVQQALYACGSDCPRDTDQQVALGQAVEAPRRGDLVFWRGHVGMMSSDQDLIHANAFHMAVVIEPLIAAVAQISHRGGGEPTAYRRLG